MQAYVGLQGLGGKGDVGLACDHSMRLGVGRCPFLCTPEGLAHAFRCVLRVVTFARNSLAGLMRAWRERAADCEDDASFDIYGVPLSAAGSLQRAVRAAVCQQGTEDYIAIMEFLKTRLTTRNGYRNCKTLPPAALKRIWHTIPGSAELGSWAEAWSIY